MTGTVKRRLPIAIAIAAIGAALFILRDRGIDPGQIGRWLSSVGDRWWAPVAFIGLYTVFNTFLIPATILTLTAGVVWGWLAGGLWVMVASAIASAVPYFIGRLGAGSVYRLLQHKAPRVYESLQREGFTGSC